MMPAAHTDPLSRQRRALVDWFMRRRGPAWTADDELAFQHWLDSDGNRQLYTQWEADWALIDALPQASAARLRAMVSADRQERRSNRPAVPAPMRRRTLFAGLATAGAVAMSVTGAWFGWQHVQAQPVYEHAFSTRKGQQSEVTLPDGSALRLDTATALSARFFRDRREIHMQEGQALFSVTADAQRPFQVTAGSIRVTVVGTRFSVRLTPSIPGRNGVEVAVEEGHVHVARLPEAAEPGGTDAELSRTQGFDLLAGQRLVFDVEGSRPALGTVAAEGVAPWRGMQLSFSDVPLRQALAEMERYADQGISYLDPAAAELRLSGTFDPRNTAATRRLLAGALPVRLTPGPSGTEVRLPR